MRSGRPSSARHPAWELTAETAPDYDDFGLFFFLQFHLDKQLRDAVAYARTSGVVLKGDLPIGIYRHSVEAWTQPELYHMDQQAGAPPDDFSDHRPELALPHLQLAAHGRGWLRLVAAAPRPPRPLLRRPAHRPYSGLLPHLGDARPLGRGPAGPFCARAAPAPPRD
ncbi:MAG: 4-alpha-glucanotransferase [Hymenobacter sp.]